MEFGLGNLITIALAVLGYAIGYGILNQKVTDLRDQRKVCEKRFEKVETETDASIKTLTETVHSIDKTLNQLVGRLDMYFSTTSIHLTKKD